MINTTALADNWMVNDTVRPGTLTRITGTHGNASSQVAFDLAASVASGLPWGGQEVRKGTVLYLSSTVPQGAARNDKAFGALDVRIVNAPAVKRVPNAMGLQLRAWKALHGVDTIENLSFAPCLEVGGEHWYAYASRFAQKRYDLIVFDDPSWTLIGSDPEVTIAGLDALIRSTGSAVLVTQDPGVRATGGSELSVSESGDTVMVRVLARRGVEPFRFTVTTVPLGTDDDGDPLAGRVLAVEAPARTVLTIPGLR